VSGSLGKHQPGHVREQGLGNTIDGRSYRSLDLAAIVCRTKGCNACVLLSRLSARAWPPEVELWRLLYPQYHVLQASPTVSAICRRSHCSLEVETRSSCRHRAIAAAHYPGDSMGGGHACHSPAGIICCDLTDFGAEGRFLLGPGVLCIERFLHWQMAVRPLITTPL
jgi:hypothetical protein